MEEDVRVTFDMVSDDFSDSVSDELGWVNLI